MSLMALVAAMRPKSKGSSTMGMKKSVVETTPRSSSSAYTAASSREALPTHSFGSRFCAPLPARIVSSTLGEILQPQPAPWLYWVRRIGSLISHTSHLRARILAKLRWHSPHYIIASFLPPMRLTMLMPASLGGGHPHVFSAIEPENSMLKPTLALDAGITLSLSALFAQAAEVLRVSAIPDEAPTELLRKFK